MEISNTQFLHGVQGLQGPHRNVATKEVAAPQTQSQPIQDEVRFSDEALQISDAQSTESSSSGVRFELVNRIKAEIAAGTYDTPDKMDIAFDRMIERMNPR